MGFSIGFPFNIGQVGKIGVQVGIFELQVGKITLQVGIFEPQVGKITLQVGIEKLWNIFIVYLLNISGIDIKSIPHMSGRK